MASLMLAATAADACSCPEPTPCQVYWQADAVFFGRVVSTGIQEIAERLDIEVATIEVEESFRGGLAGRIVVGSAARPERRDRTPPAGQRWQKMTTCDYRFAVGERYLVYARRMPDGRWTTSECSGTKPADRALDDLTFIQSVPVLPPGGRVYGSAERVRRDAMDSSRHEVTPLAGLHVTLTNDDGQHHIVSREDGRFEIAVPPGTYTARPEIPDTLKAYYPRTLTVADRGCVPTFFHVVENGRITGIVRTPSGQPITRALVHVLPVEAVTEAQVRAVSLNSGATDAHGRYEIDSLPAGRYVVGVNTHFGPRLHSPYFGFHTAAATRAAAAIVDVREGLQTGGIDIEAPRLPAANLAGRVQDAQGRPVPEARVAVGPAVSPFSYVATATADAQGRFNLRVPGRTTYVVRASLGAGPTFREALATVLVEDRTGECTLVLGAARRP